MTNAQISYPADTIVVTEKWDKDTTGKAVNESWLEAFDGDMAPDPLRPGSMLKFANRHQGGMNCTFFDGHAKWTKPEAIWKSRDLTGCRLVHQFPTIRMCDTTFAGCVSTSPLPTSVIPLTFSHIPPTNFGPCASTIRCRLLAACNLPESHGKLKG